ncbi:MAG: Lrp/AsnC family transcriptional regulator [Bilophila sp.]
MKIKLDDTNLGIIKALRNGRASFRDIAADLGLSEVTVRTRSARLIEEGVLDICGQVDVERLPGHTLALVAIKLTSPDLVQEGEAFSRLRGVVSVAVLTGRHDLVLTVLLTEDFGLLDFYTSEFSKCHDKVASVETYIVYKGFNLKVPYVL